MDKGEKTGIAGAAGVRPQHQQFME